MTLAESLGEGAKPKEYAERAARNRIEWQAGWPLLAVATLAAATSTVGFISLGSLIRPLQADNGWSRAEITAAGLIICIATFLLAPVAGRLVDRIGIRRVAIASTVAFGFGQAAVGLSTQSIWSWWVTWTLAAILMQGITPAVWAVAVVRQFTVKRGLALGITTAGVGVANMVMPLICASITQAFGWRGVYFAIGVFSLLVVFPALHFALDHKERRVECAVDASCATVVAGMSFGQAILGNQIWKLLVAIPIVAGGIGFLNLHMQEILKDHGETVIAAAALASLYGPAQIVGRLGAGYLLDRISGPMIAGIMFLLPAIGCGILLYFPDIVAAAVLPPLFAGVAAGVEIDIMAYLTSRYFGLKHYGVIYGTLFGTFSIALGLGPLVGGLLRDSYGSYDFALFLTMLALPVAALIVLSLGRYRY